MADNVVSIGKVMAHATKKSTPSHALKLWHAGLRSGLRSALACLIVGFATIYGPAALRQYMQFPAFAYVTATLIVSDATVGDSLRGATFALYGTVLTIPAAIMGLRALGPNGLTVETTTLATVISAFLVALPDSVPLIAKRIGLGQIVLVYVAAYKQGRGVDAVLHPVQVAASTALGFSAAVLAVLLPYPQLAFHEVNKMREEFKTIELERMELYTTALCAADRTSAEAAVSLASTRSKEASKLLRGIKAKQGTLKWEQPQLGVACTQSKAPFDMMQTIDRLLKGMEISLSSVASFPIQAITHEFGEYLHGLVSQINATMMEQGNKVVPNQGTNENIPVSLSYAIPLDRQNISPLFSIFCIKLLHTEFMLSCSAAKQEKKVAPVTTCEYIETAVGRQADPVKNTATLWVLPRITNEMLMVSLKCSLATGLAVLFGVLFSKDNGYWSGLAVAIAITPWRESTFKLANLRMQGTALGSVYGVIGSIVAEKFMEIRFLLILPWIVFTSLLRQSQMYGQAGGMTAAVSAIIILGRRSYGPSAAFAIARLTETCIGLLCCIFVEIILQPAKASSLARSQLCQNIDFLHECIKMLPASDGESSSTSSELNEKGKELVEQIYKLEKLIEEAAGEPNFWFVPFPSNCYGKILSSLSRMADFVFFLGHIEQLLAQEHGKDSDRWHEINVAIKVELESLDRVDDLIECLKNVMKVKPVSMLDKKLQKKLISTDLEMGEKSALGMDEKESQTVLSSYLQQGTELVENLGEHEENRDTKNRMVLLLGSCGYCISGLMKESRELEKGILELVQLENPTKSINLFEISCKEKTVV